MPFLWKTTGKKVVSLLEEKENGTLLLGILFLARLSVFLTTLSNDKEVRWNSWGWTSLCVPHISVFFAFNIMCCKITYIFLKWDCVVLKILCFTVVETEHKTCNNKKPCSCSCWHDLCCALKWPNNPAWPDGHKNGINGWGINYQRINESSLAARHY